MTSNNTSRRHRQIIAGAMVVAAATSVVGLLAGPANAAPNAYVAVAIGLVNDAPPVTTVGGIAIAASQDQAYQAALTDCVNKGGHQCVVEAEQQNGCAAAASNDFGEMVGGTDVTVGQAQANARLKLQNQQGARVVVSGCSNGAIAPPSAPPAPPKLGPTATFNPILGGLEARITDRSGVASQCTFVMDDLNRNFALAANATFDLKIVPAIPRFKDRTVTITCDNGTKTQTTTRF